MTAQTIGPMLTVREVCEQLGIGKTKFYELVNSRQLRAVDINRVDKRPVGQPGRRRSIRVEQAEVDRFKVERVIAV